jgi:hypothetical protein
MTTQETIAIETAIHDKVIDGLPFTAYDITQEVRKKFPNLRHFRFKQVIHDKSLKLSLDLSKDYTKKLLIGKKNGSKIEAFVYFDQDSDETEYISPTGYTFDLPALAQFGTPISSVSQSKLKPAPTSVTRAPLASSKTSSIRKVASNDRIYVPMSWLEKNGIIGGVHFRINSSSHEIMVRRSDKYTGVEVIQHDSGGVYISSRHVTKLGLKTGDEYELKYLHPYAFQIIKR